MNDGRAAVSQAERVNISIVDIVDAPVARDEEYSVDEDNKLVVPSNSGIPQNDTRAEDRTMEAQLVSSVEHAASFDFEPDGSFQYRHDGGSSAHDRFSYKINDGKRDSLNLATVSITINSVNDSPIAIPDFYFVPLGGTLRIDAGSGVLANDSDEERDTISVLPGDLDVLHGTLKLADDGSLTYRHSGNDTSGDRFQYMVEADQGLLVGPTTVSIVVSDEEDIPRAVSDSANTDEDTPVAIDVLSNDPEVGIQCREDLFPDGLKDRPTATPPPSPTSTTAPSPTPVAQGVTQASNLVWSFLGGGLVVDRSQLEAGRVKGNWFVQVAQGASPEYGLWKVEAESGSVEPQNPLTQGLAAYIESGCDAPILPLPFRPTPVPTTAQVVPPPAVENAIQAFDLTSSFLGQCFPVGLMTAEAFSALGNWFVPIILNSEVPLGLWQVETIDRALELQDILASELEAYVISGCDADLLPKPLLPTPLPDPTPTATPLPTPTSLPRITTASAAEIAVWAHLVVCRQDLPVEYFEATLDPGSGNWVVRSVPNPIDRDNGIWIVDPGSGSVTPVNNTADIRDDQVRRGGC